MNYLDFFFLKRRRLVAPASGLSVRHQNHHQGIFTPNARPTRLARVTLTPIAIAMIAMTASAQSTTGPMTSSMGASCLMISKGDIESLINATFFLHALTTGFFVAVVLLLVQGLLLPWLERGKFELECSWRDQITNALQQIARKDGAK